MDSYSNTFFLKNKSQRILMMNEEMVGSGPDLNILQLCDLYQKKKNKIKSNLSGD